MADRRLFAVAAALVIATVAVAQEEEQRENATQLMSLNPSVVEEIQARLSSDGVVPDDDYHYGNPADGCMTGEDVVAIPGMAGRVCSPRCVDKKCPTDSPPGTSAHPECILDAGGASSPTNCALVCRPSDDGKKCPPGAVCEMTVGVGICMYK